MKVFRSICNQMGSRSSTGKPKALLSWQLVASLEANVTVKKRSDSKRLLPSILYSMQSDIRHLKISFEDVAENLIAFDKGGCMTTRKEKIAEFDQGYTITVTGRHVQVTDGMKQHAVDKLAKIDRLGNRIMDVAVTMDIQKLDHKVDIVMKYGHTIIKSHACTTDMYASIDKAIDKLQTQLAKYKNKIQDHHAKEHPVTEIPEKVYGYLPGDDLAEINQEIESENLNRHADRFHMHKVVKVATRPLKILNDDEAIMKMELSQEPVMVFRGEADRRLKVIWRMEDGNYGIIEPE